MGVDFDRQSKEELDDYQDLRCFREAKEAEKDAMTIGMAGLKERSGLLNKINERRIKRCSLGIQYFWQ
jgi:hypothetical protein